MAAVPAAWMVPLLVPNKRRKLVGMVRLTVTRVTLIGSDDKLTPGTAPEPGNETVTVSSAVLPKPLYRAYTQGVRASDVVQVKLPLVENAAVPEVLVLFKMLIIAASAAASAAACAMVR